MLNTLREELEHRNKSNNERNEFRMAIVEDYFIDLIDEAEDPGADIKAAGGDTKVEAPKGGDDMKMPKGTDKAPEVKAESYFDVLAYRDMISEDTKSDANLDTWLTQDIDPDDDYEHDVADEVKYDSDFTKEVDFDDDFTSDFLTDYEPNNNLAFERDYVDDATDVFETDALDEAYLFEDIDPDTDAEFGDDYGISAEEDDADSFNSDLDPDIDDSLMGMSNGSLDEFDDSADPFAEDVMFEDYLFEEADEDEDDDDDDECDDEDCDDDDCKKHGKKSKKSKKSDDDEELEDEDEDDEDDDEDSESADAIDTDEDGDVLKEKGSKSESFSIYDYFGLI